MFSPSTFKNRPLRAGRSHEGVLSIAKNVLFIRFFRVGAGILISTPSSSDPKAGKSSLGRVEIEYLPKPDSMKSLSPFKYIEISDPSGKSLQSSLSLFAGAVVLPPVSTLALKVVLISDSVSVAVSDMFPPSSTIIKTFDKTIRNNSKYKFYP